MQNPYLSYASARLACMFYFMAPGLAYGLVTSRMPALKNMTGATEGELGIILLCFGLSALIGLAFAPRLIAKISAKTTLLASSLACMVFVVLVSFSSSVWFFGIAMALLGICMGLCDVTMNVQGVEVERAYKKSSMNILHAGYNIGAAAAACAGSIFAATNFGVWVNFVLPVAIMAGMLWWAEPRLVTENLEKPERSESSPLVSVEPKKRLPFLVWVCGLLCVCCYVSEGSVGEWGSLYLHQEKAAPESIAALVFAGFSICSLMCRLVADRLRNNFGDFLVSTAGATLALAGMLTVLSSSSWSICLIGYAMMGLGQAPIVPIAFSRAGAIKGVSTARATSLVSLLAYAGLLFAPPPAFGLSAEHFGLHTALCAVPVLLTITVLLAFLLGRLIKHSREDTQAVGS